MNDVTDQTAHKPRRMAHMTARANPFIALFAALALLLTPLQSMAQGISIIRDAETERLIREYADPVLLAAGLAPDSVRIYLINDPSINAFATVGRRMGIHTGLILAAETPNELIGVIAHEAGHIAGGHVARIGEAIANASTPALITMGLGILAAVAGAPEAGLALLLGGQHIAQRNILAYSRVQEAAADQAAVSYLNEVGWSSEGLIGFFEKFRDQELLSTRRQDPFVRSHPLSSDRIAALRSRVAESPHTGKPDSPESIRRFGMVQAKIHGFLDRPDVTFRRYPATDTSNEAHYARTVAYFRRGEVDQALGQLEPLIEAEPNNPFFQELKGQVYFETGRAEMAVAPYRRAVEILPDEGIFKLLLAQSLLATDEAGQDQSIAKEAIRLLEDAARTQNENSFVWHQLAIAYARMGNEPLAALATAERFFVAGQYERAFGFASRARKGLSAGTPEWNRSNDIIQASESEVRNRR